MDEQALLKSATGEIWKKVGIRHHHGIDLALTSLHSKNSCGVGEFLDLLPLIDWCKRVNFDVIQLLPLNDTGEDPSPYNALSSCAFDPIYISLHSLPYLDTLPELNDKLKDLKKTTQTQRVAFNQVKVQKLYWLRQYFDAVSGKIIKNADFAQFQRENGWAAPYALFKALKDKLGHAHWKNWPIELQNLKKPDYESLLKQHEKECAYYLFLQYLAHIQIKTVRAHAKKSGILLKGDIPILISPDSVDVWHNPEFFNLEFGAGAPPKDPYTGEKQQYWGFPLYKWEVLKESGYFWWKQRLSAASVFYDLYRIDHAVGLFRIWAIPVDQPDTIGKFIPEDPSLWFLHGKGILEMMISSSPMLPIAEDLGFVPPSSRECLKELGIPGTKVMRWERFWDKDKSFIPFQDYPTVSMTCVSTHDSETLTQWWKNQPEEATAFCAFMNWNYESELSLEKRREILYHSHHTASLFHINLLQEYLALFPDLIWPNPDDERINVPGTLLPTNWSYRFKPSIETLLSRDDVATAISKLLI